MRVSSDDSAKTSRFVTTNDAGSLGGGSRPQCCATLLFMSNALSAILSVLSDLSGSSGMDSRSWLETSIPASTKLLEESHVSYWS